MVKTRFVRVLRTSIFPVSYWTRLLQNPVASAAGIVVGFVLDRVSRLSIVRPVDMRPNPVGSIVWIVKRHIARILRVQMSTAESYRKLAAELNAKAVRERSATLTSEYEHLALAYLRLAEQADRNERLDLHLEVGPAPKLDSSGGEMLEDEQLSRPPCIRCWSPTQALSIDQDEDRRSDVRLFRCEVCGFVTSRQIKRRGAPPLRPSHFCAWGDEPITVAQASHLKTLSEQHGRLEAFAEDLTKAEASKRIDTLKGQQTVSGPSASPQEKQATVT